MSRQLSQQEASNLTYISKNIAQKARVLLAKEPNAENIESFAWNASNLCELSFMSASTYDTDGVAIYSQLSERDLTPYLDLKNPIAVVSYAHAFTDVIALAINTEKLDDLNLNRKIDRRLLGRIANQMIENGFEKAARRLAENHLSDLRRNRNKTRVVGI